MLKLNFYSSDPCPNGAAHYLYVAGIVILVTAGINIISQISKYLALMVCNEL